MSELRSVPGDVRRLSQLN